MGLQPGIECAYLNVWGMPDRPFSKLTLNSLLDSVFTALPQHGKWNLIIDSLCRKFQISFCYRRIPMGVKLLRKMGWKEGQGIGARIKKKMTGK